MRIQIVEPIDVEEQRSGEKVPPTDDVECPICLQPYLEPVITKPCQHSFCRHCILRAACPPDLYAEDHRAECPVCRTTITRLETSPALARLVVLQYGHDYEEKRRKDSDVPQREATEAVETNPVRELMLNAIREQGGYRTLALNSKLDLSCTGLEALDPCLNELSGLRMLRLETNLLRGLGGLELPQLVSLIAHHNQVQQLGDAMRGLSALVRLDLAHNLLTDLQGVELLPSLQTLNVSHNRLASAAAVDALRECASTLDVLDLSSNQLPSNALEPIGALSARLRVLYLRRNPLVEQVSASQGSYRKRLIVRFGQLSYLDDQPVSAHERRAAEAWAEGGDAGEKAVRERFQTERQDKVRRNTEYMMRLKENALSKRRASEAAAASTAAMQAAAARVNGRGGAGSSSADAASSSSAASPSEPARRASAPPDAAAAAQASATSGTMADSVDGKEVEWRPAWDRVLMREAAACHFNWVCVAQSLRAVSGGPKVTARDCAERWAQLDDTKEEKPMM